LTTYNNVSGSWDGKAQVWAVDSGQEVARMTHGIGTVVTSVAFSPDGKYALTGSWDGTARVWRYRPEDLIADVCARVRRNLTRFEWQYFIGDVLPYDEKNVACTDLPIEPELTATPIP